MELNVNECSFCTGVGAGGREIREQEIQRERERNKETRRVRRRPGMKFPRIL